MIVELDGRQMTDRNAAHNHLRTQLALPEYYGRNLDALYDLLTERGEHTTIVVRFRAEMETGLGKYAGALIKTLNEAAERNPFLRIQE